MSYNRSRKCFLSNLPNQFFSLLMAGIVLFFIMLAHSPEQTILFLQNSFKNLGQQLEQLINLL